jgi:hypothetical protein
MGQAYTTELTGKSPGVLLQRFDSFKSGFPTTITKSDRMIAIGLPKAQSLVEGASATSGKLVN